MVAGEVPHVGKDAACKVYAATPAVGLIVALVGDKSTPLHHLPIQAKDVQRSVVTAEAQTP